MNPLLSSCVSSFGSLVFTSHWPLVVQSRAMGKAIPANSILVFDVELIAVNGRTSDQEL
eukprot:m.63356 g.63356  ORF g.63356 m.63356 type:complete len:59 (-) comp49635_c0_seq1:119-295(-)